MKKIKTYQQGGGLFGGLFNGLDFDALNTIADSGLFTNDFSFENASVLGLSGQNLGLSGAFAGSLSQDDPSIYSNYVTGAFNQQGAQQLAQNQTDSFLADPTVEGLDTFGQGLRPGQRRRIERRLNKGKDLTGRQNRLLGRSATNLEHDINNLGDTARTPLDSVVQQNQTDLTSTTQGLGSLFEMFSNLFQFQQGGAVGTPFQVWQGIPKKDKASIEVALNALQVADIKEFQGLMGIKQSGRKNKMTLEALESMYYDEVFGNKMNRSPYPVPPKELQTGGDVARQGYAQGSPYQNRSSITIPGGNIDMSNTPRSLYLVPDVGQPVMAHPFSGQHIFPRANSVREVPVGQYGGDIPPSIAQLEIGELVALSDASIIKPKAKERHKDMKKDEVTDIFPAGAAYVMSDDPKMNVTLKEAKNISLGYGAVEYKELGSDGKQPEEILLSRFFKTGEKKLTPAEILRRVQKEFPISEETDIFAQRSSFRNKESRIPYIQALRYLTDKRKEQRGEPPAETEFQVKSTNPFGVSYTEMLQEMQVNRLKTNPDEGYVSTPVVEKQGTIDPQRAQLGGVIAQAVPALFNSIFGQIQAGKTRKEAERLGRKNEAALRQEALRQQGYLGAGTAFGFGALLAQNPEVQAAQYDPRYVQAAPQRLPQSLYDVSAGRIAGVNRPFIDAIFANTGDYSRAVNALAPLQQNSVSAMAGIGQQAEMTNLGLRQNYLQGMDQFSRMQTAANTEAANATRGNQNAILGQAGALGTNYFNQQGAISSGLTGSLMGNDANTFNARTAARQQGQQALGQGLGALSMVAASSPFQSLFGQQAPAGGYQYTGGTGGYSTPYDSPTMGVQGYSPSFFQTPYHNQYFAPQMGYQYPFNPGFIWPR